jgi:hypothetical protein
MSGGQAGKLHVLPVLRRRFAPRSNNYELSGGQQAGRHTHRCPAPPPLPRPAGCSPKSARASVETRCVRWAGRRTARAARPAQQTDPRPAGSATHSLCAQGASIMSQGGRQP